MEKIFLVLLSIFFSLNIYSKGEDIYVDALSRFFEEVIKEVTKKGDKVYFKRIGGITDAFPDSTSGHPIIIVNGTEDAKMFGNRDKIYLHYVFPLKYDFKSNSMYVPILNTIYFPDKKRLLAGCNTCHIFVYKYNRKRKIFVYDHYESVGDCRKIWW